MSVNFAKVIRLALALMWPLLGGSVLAKHVLPRDVQPVVVDGIRYTVPNDKARKGYIQAWDVQTGKKLWEKTIFKCQWIPLFTNECMSFEYISSTHLDGVNMIIETDRKRVFALDLARRKVKRK